MIDFKGDFKEFNYYEGKAFGDVVTTRKNGSQFIREANARD
jgi:hypothetical protein